MNHMLLPKFNLSDINTAFRGFPRDQLIVLWPSGRYREAEPVLDLSAVQGYRQIGNRCILRFAAAMAHDGIIPVALGHAYGIDGFGDGSDLFTFTSSALPMPSLIPFSRRVTFRYKTGRRPRAGICRWFGEHFSSLPIVFAIPSSIEQMEYCFTQQLPVFHQLFVGHFLL